MTDTAVHLRFADGLGAFPRALRILWRKPGILRWLIPPFLITLLLDGLAFKFGFAWLRSEIGRLITGDGYLAWLRSLLDVVGGIAIVFVLGWSFAWLFLILTSPFQDFISADVEREMRGVAGPEPAGLTGFLRSILQSAVQAVVFSLITLAFLLVGLIPVLGPVLLFTWTAFALGYSFIAIPSGRMAHRISERLAFARKHRGAVMGLGVVVAGAALLPVANVILMPLFVIGGTVLYVEAAHPETLPESRNH